MFSMNNIHFLQLGEYTRPEIKEVKNKDWVAYGEDNDYFDYLIDNFNGSPTNNAVINGIIQQIYGSGLDAKDKARKPEQWANLKSMLHADCLRNAVCDLKITGQAALQVVYDKGKKKVKRVEHFPVNTLRAEKANEEGEIEGYYYHHDWAHIKPHDQPKRIPAFGSKNSELIEILYIKPYALGYFYYSPVDYQGCLPYCELEQEVANYHINNVKNGLTAGALINFNNGIPDTKDQKEIEAKIAAKFSGSTNAGKFVLAFNRDKEAAATIEPLQLSDAHAQYEFLSAESTQKIMVGHRVTSPMLLGIKDQTGLGNNAEELKTAIALFEATVINPFRLLLIDAIERIMEVNDLNLNIYFRSLSPFEEADEQEAVQSEQNLSAQTHLEASEKDNRPFLNDELAEELLEALEGLGESEEDLLADFEFVDSEDAEDEPADFDAEEYLNNREDFAAQQDSDQDSERYKVRYVYTKGTRKEPKGESRPLCRALMSAGKVYRKEDILKLSSKGGAQSKGQEYSVWKFKGGANCYHRWERRVYRKKLNKNGEAWGGGALSGTKKISVNDAIRQGFKLPKNPKEVAIAPIDTPTKGYKS